MPPVQTASAAAPDAPPAGPQPTHRLSAACTGCHSFGGHDQQAHNRTFESRPDLANTDCLMCHTEHKGVNGRNTRLTQPQCQSCHTRSINNFASGHAPFSPNFPYDHPQSIRFDHVSHFGKHFAEPTVADKVPPGRCVGCHVVGQGGRALKPANFQTVCAGCHEEGIAKRDLVFFRWPEIATNTIEPADVAKACSAPADAKAATPGVAAPAFSAVSSDPPTALGGFILGVPSDSVADYEKPIQDLARAMITDGAEPLLAAARDRVSSAQTDRLFAGLDTEMTRQATCAWAANQEYAPPTKATLPGWRAEALDLRYTRPGHADPVVKAWIDFVAGVPTPEGSDAQVRLQRARKELLSPDGPGQCAKCHTVSGQPDGTLAVSWKVQFRNAAPQTRFDHRPHLSLLGPEKTCTSCHQLGDETSEVGAKLKPISLATCTECHTASKIRDDCRTCHVYHQDHALKKRMVEDAH